MGLKSKIKKMRNPTKIVSAFYGRFPVLAWVASYLLLSAAYVGAVYLFGGVHLLNRLLWLDFLVSAVLSSFCAERLISKLRENDEKGR